MKKTALLLVCICFSIFSQAQHKKHFVNFSGNSYVVNGVNGVFISDKGLTNWSSEQSKINTYVYFSKPQTISVAIKGVVKEGNSVIKLTSSGQSHLVELSQGHFENNVGDFIIESAGYTSFSLEGVAKDGNCFAEVESLIIESQDNLIVYVHDFSDYWGRRGPSVHLNYEMPEGATIEWFYNEVTVPENNDVLASYYMANGFGEGYFGMQVNSPTERRILFSVWSPFDTQDPSLIPDSLKIKLLRKGEGVHIGEFGNEGSGGQSFLRYDWKAGNTYKFLTQIKPTTDNKATIYTSYFYATDENRWRLIASFLRPETDTYYTRAHSFLENFSPAQGYVSRKVFFGNQWYRTTDGEWIAGKKALFSHDDTARKGVRIDYRGGYCQDENKFFLENCGFFSKSTKFGTAFELRPSNEPPIIDFELLEKL